WRSGRGRRDSSICAAPTASTSFSPTSCFQAESTGGGWRTRRPSSDPDLRVLFTTGYTRNAIVHDGRLDPDVRLITKPYTQEILARSLRRIIDEARPLT